MEYAAALVRYCMRMQEKDLKKMARRNVPAVYYSFAHAMVLRICGENASESLALFFKSCKKG